MAASPDMTDNHRHNRIQRLSDQAIRDVHSSKNITSIEDVAISLIANSLDAGASKIEVTIDRSRGNCIVGDDGCGIPSYEFLDGGGLFKMYWTSKRNEPLASIPQMHGTNGTFLAQLGNLSLLKISSADNDRGQFSSLTIHCGKVIHRRVDLEHTEDSLTGRGTSVVVTDLFGSMPVRIKNRASQSSTHRQQSRQALKYQIAALMLAWPYPCSIRIQDEGDSSCCLRLASNSPNQPATLSARSLKAHDGASIQYNIQDVLSVLFQAGLAPWESRQSWIPVSATTRSIRLDGMICSRPSPTKTCQFIALGIRPLEVASGNKELYDCANGVFAKSSFSSAMTQTGKDFSANDLGQDRRSLNFTPSNKRGPVDRHAMFCFRFMVRDGVPCDAASETVSPKSLRPFLDLLRLTITAWLEEHHFVKRRAQLQDPTHSSSTSRQNLATRKDGFGKTAAKGVNKIALTNVSSSESENCRLVQSVDVSDHRPSFSAMRAGKLASGLGKGVRSALQGTSLPYVSSVGPLEGDAARARVSEIANHAEGGPAVESSQKAVANALVAMVPPHEVSYITMLHEMGTTRSATPTIENNVFDWVDPVSRRLYKINARTGVTIPKSSCPAVVFKTPRLPRGIEVAPPSGLNSDASASSRSSWVLEHSEGTSLPGVLADWHNPVFEKQKEEAITAAPTASLLPDKTSDDVPSFQSSVLQTGSVLNGGKVTSISTTEMISREQLRAAKVIGQVDYKFILCKIQVPSTTESPRRDVLLLIDQHAASERIILEGLLREYGVPNMLHAGPSSSSSGACLRTADVSRYTSYYDYLYYDEISETERKLLQHYHKHFAAWGVLYELNELRHRSTDTEEEPPVLGKVRVKMLPRAIVERCSSTPSLCIEMIRAEIYDNTRKPLSQRQMDMATSELHEDNTRDEAPLWLKYVSFCPQGILDMLNSRACRTAVMFNDRLSQRECEDMVRKLGMCVFPFVCAHGRKSIVPLQGLDMLSSKTR